MHRLQRLLRVGNLSFNSRRSLLHLDVSRGFSLSSEVRKDTQRSAENVKVIFRELGVRSKVAQVLREKSVKGPTPLQSAVIPLITRKFKNLVVRAKIGSGKTFAYLISMVENLNFYTDPDTTVPKDIVPSAIVLLPTLELCHQTIHQLEPFLKCLRLDTEVIQLKPSSRRDDLPPRSSFIVVSTPDSLLSCLSKQYLKTESSHQTLEFLILDEADQLLTNGFEGDLRSILAHVPKSCQCLVFSSDPSADVQLLKRFTVGNPYIVILPEVGDVKVEISPFNMQQSYITCNSPDKIICFVLLMKNTTLHHGVTFTNSFSMSQTLKQYTEQYEFGPPLRAAVVDPKLPDDRCVQILEDFNAGRIDQLIIASTEQSSDWESVVVGRLNLDSVNTVFNFDMPKTAPAYAVRINPNGRPRHKIGKTISLVLPEETSIINQINSFFGDEDSKTLVPYDRWCDEALEDYRPSFEVYTEIMNLEARGLPTWHFTNKCLELGGIKNF